MRRTISQEELKQILQQHKLWLDSDRKKGVSADLRFVDLCGANLTGANLKEANLFRGELRGANLTRTNLEGVDLFGANLFRVDLTGANLKEANLKEANLKEANLEGVDLCGANLFRVELRGSDLTNTKFSFDIPVVSNIDQKILDIIKKDENCLEMSQWHTCETTHCLAGWAVHLAGESGYQLEKLTTPYLAGRLIYEKSRGDGTSPDFFNSNEGAIRELEEYVRTKNQQNMKKVKFINNLSTNTPLYVEWNGYYNKSVVTLELRTGEYYFELVYSGPTSQDKFNGLDVEFHVRNDLTSSQYEDLAKDLAPILQKLLDDSEIYCDGSNWKGRIKSWESDHGFYSEITQNLINSIECSYECETYGFYELGYQIKYHDTKESFIRYFNELTPYESCDPEAFWDAYHEEDEDAK